ncbi:MAG: translation initiation factor IF-2 [Candidatus Paceibacterota bacterium]
MATEQNSTTVERPPVIVVMGHIDHGKSTLLDYIRKTNVTESEAGGITQHLSAYEVMHERDDTEKRITFLDTPGHEAFTAMRSRGASVADVAILVIAADDGVKEQTLEALQSIKDADIPYIIAVNKIDKENADVQATLNSLVEHEIYVEGYGGDISYAQISAKTGEGVDELLDLILLQAEIEELTMDLSKPAEGVIIESNVDPSRGTSATLVIMDGTLSQGQHIQAGTSTAPVRIMEDYIGKTIQEATASSPVRITGFDASPAVGVHFHTFESKKEAQEAAAEKETKRERPQLEKTEDDVTTIPIIIKTDVAGTAEAIAEKVAGLVTDRAHPTVLEEGLGSVTEGDVRRAGAAGSGVIVGFNVGVETGAQELADRTEVTIKTFSIIYDLVEWLEEEIQTRTPKIEVREKIGEAKVLKTFSRTRKNQIIGGKVTSGSLTQGAQFVITRRGEEIGEGVFSELQKQKAKTSEVQEGSEFGADVETKFEIAIGDILVAFKMVEK